MTLVSEIHHVFVFIIIFIVIHIIILHQTNKNLNITLKQKITVREGQVVQLHSATKEELVQQAEDYYDDQWNTSQANDVTLTFNLKYHPVKDLPPNFRYCILHCFKSNIVHKIPLVWMNCGSISILNVQSGT